MRYQSSNYRQPSGSGAMPQPLQNSYSQLHAMPQQNTQQISQQQAPQTYAQHTQGQQQTFGWQNPATAAQLMPYSTCGSFNGMPPATTGATTSGVYSQPLPTMPTGFPTGGTTTPLVPAQTGLPAVPLSELPPATVQSTMYTPGFLRTQIGKRMRVEFLIGTSNITDRTGTLVGVGASYILLQLIDSDDIMLCDIYSIKFVTFIL